MRIRAYAVAGLLMSFSAATSIAQAPWTVTITLTANPLPIGTCHTVLLTVVDPKTKGTPVTPLRKYVSVADFDMKVQAAAIGKYESASIWSVCACQFATVGGPGTISATYPAKGLAEDSRVPGVAFKSEIPFTFTDAQSKYSAAGCDAVAASGAAASGAAASGAAASGAAASGAAYGGAASGGAAGSAAGSSTIPSGSGTVSGAAAGAGAGGSSSGGAAGAAAGGTASGAAAGAVAGGAAGAAGAAAGGAAAGAASGSTSGTASSGGAATGAASGAATGGAATAGAATTPVPPPLNVRVLPGDSPLVEILAWDRLSGITGYNVFISTNAETGPWTLLSGKPLHTETFTDSATRRSGTVYRVTALYADGRQASTDVVYKGR